MPNTIRTNENRQGNRNEREYRKLKEHYSSHTNGKSMHKRNPYYAQRRVGELKSYQTVMSSGQARAAHQEKMQDRYERKHRWSNQGVVGAAKVAVAARKLAKGKTAKAVVNVMQAADDAFWIVDDLNHPENKNSKAPHELAGEKFAGWVAGQAVFGLMGLSEATLTALSIGGAAALGVNHGALIAINKARKIDKAAEQYGVWKGIEYVAGASEQPNGFGLEEPPQYRTLPYPTTEFTGATRSPMTSFTPRLLEISYLKTEEERSRALQEIGFSLSTEFSDERNLVVISPDGQPVVVFRGTDPTNAKDLNTDRKILMGANEDEIRRVQKGRQLVKQVGRAYGRDDTMALGHSLGGYLAQRSNAPGGVITYNKLSTGQDSMNAGGQFDYRTNGDFASHRREQGSIPTTQFAGGNPLLDPRDNHSNMEYFQKFVDQQSQYHPEGPQIGPGAGQDYLDGSRKILPSYPSIS